MADDICGYCGEIGQANLYRIPKWYIANAKKKKQNEHTLLCLKAKETHFCGEYKMIDSEFCIRCGRPYAMYGIWYCDSCIKDMLRPKSKLTTTKGGDSMIVTNTNYIKIRVPN